MTTKSAVAPSAAPVPADEGGTVIAGITTVGIAVCVARARTVIAAIGRTIVAAIGRYADADADSNARVCRSCSGHCNAARYHSADCNFRQDFHIELLLSSLSIRRW
jgi:hypothetical protein